MSAVKEGGSLLWRSLSRASRAARADDDAPRATHEDGSSSPGPPLRAQDSSAITDLEEHVQQLQATVRELQRERDAAHREAELARSQVDQLSAQVEHLAEGADAEPGLGRAFVGQPAQVGDAAGLCSAREWERRETTSAPFAAPPAAFGGWDGFDDQPLGFGGAHLFGGEGGAAAALPGFGADGAGFGGGGDAPHGEDAWAIVTASQSDHDGAADHPAASPFGAEALLDLPPTPTGAPPPLPQPAPQPGAPPPPEGATEAAAAVGTPAAAPCAATGPSAPAARAPHPADRAELECLRAQLLERDRLIAELRASCAASAGAGVGGGAGAAQLNGVLPDAGALALSPPRAGGSSDGHAASPRPSWLWPGASDDGADSGLNTSLPSLNGSELTGGGAHRPARSTLSLGVGGEEESEGEEEGAADSGAVLDRIPSLRDPLPPPPPWLLVKRGSVQATTSEELSSLRRVSAQICADKVSAAGGAARGGWCARAGCDARTRAARLAARTVRSAPPAPRAHAPPSLLGAG